jgi:asparagine synthase (glutamine-hydrolysing)
VSEAGALFGAALLPSLTERGLAGQRLLAHHYARTGGPPLRRARAVDIATYLSDGLMPKVDVGAMAHALEVRAPLLDHRVIEFGLSLPEPLLRRDGIGKLPLRALWSRRVPPTLFERPKMGFRVPLAPWLRAGGGAHLDALVEGSALLDRRVVSREGLAALIDDHRAGRRDRSQQLFSLMMLEHWLATA